MAVEITRSHHLDKATARRMVKDVAAPLTDQLGLRCRWEGDRLTFERLGAKGFIEIADQQVRIVVNKSPLLPVSEAQIREQIEATLDEYLSNNSP